MKILSQWQTYALGSAFFAALVVVLAKIGTVSISSNVATLIRTLVITVFLITLISLRKEWINPLILDKKSCLFLVLSGLATGLSWICYFRALQMGPASGVVSLDKLSLIFAVILSTLFLHESLNWQQWGGVLLMTGGALLLVYK